MITALKIILLVYTIIMLTGSIDKIDEANKSMRCLFSAIVAVFLFVLLYLKF